MNRISTKSYRFFPILALVTLALNGCSWSVGQFTMISTRTYDPSTKYVFVGHFTGEDILLFGRPDIASAVNNAIEAGKGTYLTNAEIRWYNGFSRGYEVAGDVYAPASQSDLINPNIELYDLRISNGKSVLQGKTRAVTIDAGLTN